MKTVTQNNLNSKHHELPSSIGPYTQSIETNNIIFISGQIPIIPNTLLIPNNIYDQTYQVLKNIKNIIESKKLTINNIVKTTLFIKDMNDLSIINTSYKKFFESHTSLKVFKFPARSCVEVSRLPKDVKIEIESIAMRF